MQLKLIEGNRVVDSDDGAELQVVATAEGGLRAVYSCGAERLEFPIVVRRCPTRYRTRHGMISPTILIPAHEVNYAMVNHKNYGSDTSGNTRLVEKIVKMIALVNKASPLSTCDPYFWSDFSDLKKMGAAFHYKMPPNEVLIDLSIAG